MSVFRFVIFACLTCFQVLGLLANDSLRIAHLVESYVDERGFSGTILVAKEGEAIYRESFGLAYRATPDTIQNDYHFSVASVTKLFTSIRVLQLVQEEKIDLQQSLVNYLPEFSSLVPEAVRIHDLLNHLSGLPQEPISIYQHEMDPEEMLVEILKKAKPKARGNFQYNNLDYMLLGVLIEKISGMSYQENIKTCILEPLGMTETGFLKYGDYPDNFAYTYSQKGKKLKQDVLFYIENCFAAGEMYSTAEDLLKLDQGLYTDQLLEKDAKAALERSNPEYGYAGYGVWNYTYPFVESQARIMERRGGILGANVVLVRLIDDNYTIIILSNDNRFDPDSFGDETNLREMLIRGLY